MKKMFLLLLAAALVSIPVGAGLAQAAVALSEHDMSRPGFTFGGGWGGYGVCSYCHVPHAAQGARLWAAPTGATTPPYGGSVVALLCYTCHDSTASSNADHRLSVYDATVTNHVLPDSAAIPNTDQSVTTWPWTTAGTDMECSSCHNPHDNVNNQFLRDEPYNDTPTAITAANDPNAETSQFCNNCHQDRAFAGAENGTAGVNDGTHPAGSTVVDGRKYGTAGTVTIGGIFIAPIDNAGGGFDPSALGAHLSSYTTGGVVCNTCHMPHDAYDNRVLAVDNTVTASYNGLCEQCHSVQPSLRFAVDRAVHPVDANTGDATTANGPVALNDPDWAVNLLVGFAQENYIGTNGEVICLSCHDVHFSAGTTPMLREELVIVDGSICNDCHTGAPVAGGNHPAGDVAEAEIVNEDGGTWPNNDGLPLGGSTGTRVVCDTCHSAHDGDTGATWLLRVRNGNSEICNGCHTQLDNTASDWTGAVTPPALFAAGGDSANPSGYIGNENYDGTNAATGSLLGTHAAYRTIDKTEFADSLTEATSGRTNSYGTAGTTIICESCHLVHGAAIPGGWHGTAGSENLLFFENGAGTARTDPNSGAYAPADDTYCSACHADRTAPGTNPVAPSGTHPVQAWPVTRTGGAAVNTGAGSFADVNPPAATADYNGGTGGIMTCESCHAPHAAETSPGSFILEGGTGASVTGGTRPATRNRDGLCLKCHTY